MSIFDLTSLILENQIQEFVIRRYFVPNTNDAYCVGSDGSVWSRLVRVGWGRWIIGGVDDWKKLVLTPEKTGGYLICCLTINDKRITVIVHQLVADLLLGPCPPGLECCHNDGTRQNNHVCNLRYDTPTNNQRDRFKHGTHNRGDNHPQAVLNQVLADQIREEYATGQYTYRQLGKKHGVTFANIGYIVRYETWVPVEA